MNITGRRITGLDTGETVNSLNARVYNMQNAQNIIGGAIKSNHNCNIVVVGDSITQGVGSTSVSIDSWASKFRDILNENGAGAYGFEDSYNFDVSANCSGLTSTSGVLTGTQGALKQSLTLTVGQTLVFGGNYHFIDFFYERSAGAGSAQIARDGVTVSTKSMAGATASDICTYDGTTVSIINKNSTWTITATVGTIIITGLIRRRITPASSKYAWLSRVGKGGSNTADFAGAAQLASLAAIGAYDSAKTVYVLALGTNDIYNTGGKALSSSAYITNLRTLISGLTTTIAECVIVVPPLSDPALISPFYEAHSTYRARAIALGAELGVGVIDLSNIDLEAQAGFFDNLHPNDYGHTLFCQQFIHALGIPALRPIFRMIDDLTDSDVWTKVDTASQPRVVVVGNRATLLGGSLSNGSASLVSANITALARPDVNRSYSAVGGGADGNFKATVGTTGNITMGTAGRAACWYDGMSWPIVSNLG
jgi:lysophospholipase L1-like esterase